MKHNSNCPLFFIRNGTENTHKHIFQFREKNIKCTFEGDRFKTFSDSLNKGFGVNSNSVLLNLCLITAPPVISPPDNTLVDTFC